MRVRTVCARLFAQLLVSAMFLILVDGAPRQAQAADPAAGEAVFHSECAICHSPKPDVNKIGPSLFEVVGRKTGSVPKYKYSVANKNSNITWTPEDPGQIPGVAGQRRSRNENAVRRAQGPDQACRPDRLPRDPEKIMGSRSLPKRPSQEDSMSPLRRLASRRQVLGGGLALATLPAPFVRARRPRRSVSDSRYRSPGLIEEEALDMLRGGHVAVAMFNAQGDSAARRPNL